MRLQAQRLEESRAARHAAIVASDGIVQQLAAARWMIEAGNTRGALAALDTTVARGIAEVSSALPPLSPSRPASGAPLDPVEPGGSPEMRAGPTGDRPPLRRRPSPFGRRPSPSR